MALQNSWLLIGALVAATPAYAQDRQPFERGVVGLEFAAVPLVEIWNLNDHREPMIGISASAWGAVSDRFSLGVEFQHAFVIQHTPGAFVQGISQLVRWRIGETGRWHWFADGGPGVSWSDLETPPRGTRFNYLFQAGAGAMRRVARSQHLVIAYRFLHLSNNKREGRDRNPDLEMMGLYTGWAFSF